MRLCVAAAIVVAACSDEERSTYGDIRSLGYFFTQVKIGTPQQTFTVIIDTGSAMTIVPCVGCANCGNGHDLDNPLFDASLSSTSGVEKALAFSKSYMEGSSLGGMVLADDLCIGATCRPRDSFVAFFGCATKMTNLFKSQNADGIMGMGVSSDRQSGARSALQSLVAARGEAHAAFEFCFGRAGGFIVLGEWYTTHHVAPMQWAALRSLLQTPFYEVSVSTIGFAAAAAVGVDTHVMIDTGSSFSYAPQATFDALKAALDAWCAADTASRCRGEVLASVEGSLACFDFGRDATQRAMRIASFPPLRVALAGAADVDGASSSQRVELCIPPSQYFYAVDPRVVAGGGGAGGDDAVQQGGCVGIVADSLWTIGANFLMDYSVVLDMTPPRGIGSNAERIGFARAKCGTDAVPWQCASDPTVADLARAPFTNGLGLDWGSPNTPLSFDQSAPSGVIRMDVGHTVRSSVASEHRRRRRRLLSAYIAMD